MNLLLRIGCWLDQRTKRADLINRFLATFGHDRCPVCSYHRFGVSQGFTAEEEPPDHYCPEREPPHD